MRESIKRLGISAVIAALIVVFINLLGPGRAPRSLVAVFLVSLSYSTAIGSLAWWVMPKLAPRVRGSAFVRWVQILLLLFAIGIVGGSLAYLAMVWQPFFRMKMAYRESMTICVVFTLAVGAMMYVIEQFRYRVQATTLELRTRELERERALKAASDARLQSLESRIHPHFLFNTLNSISSLVRSNPEGAEAMIGQLADLLRFSLDRHGSLVSVEDELKITQDYLAIESARFGDRLQFSFDLPESILATKLPAMSLQTLVENSVKYAVSAQRNGATIQVRACREAQAICFAVIDSGPGFSHDSLPIGHGLDCLRQRLESQFGSAATLTTRRLEPGMEVAFRIPC